MITKKKSKKELLRQRAEKLSSKKLKTMPKIQDKDVQALVHELQVHVNEQLKQEITERKKIEEILRQSETKFRILADNTYDIEFWINPEGRYIFVSHSCERITGHSPNEFMENPRLRRNLVHPEDLPIFDRHLREEEEEEVTPREVQFRIIRPDGSIRWIGHLCQRIFDEEGRFLGIRGSNRDITERKKAEEALEAARVEVLNEKNRLEAVMDALPVGVAITDTRGGTIRFNHAFDAVWGNPRPTALSVSDYAAYKAWWPETGRPVVPKEWASAQAIEKGEPVVGQLLEIQRFDGSRASVINSGAPIFDANGKIAGCAVAIQDITDLREAENALQKSEKRYRSYIEMTEQLGWTTNADGEVVEDIPSWRKFTGQSEEDIKGWGWSKALHPDDFERVVQMWRNAVAKKINYEVEYRIRRHDGLYRHFLTRGVPFVKDDGNIQEWVGTCIDITDRKQMEEELRKSRDELEMRVQQRTTELAKANELLERMFSNVNISIAYMDKDFNFIRVNRAYAKADEREPEFYVGKNHFALFPNEENEQIFRKVAEKCEPYFVYGKPFEYAEHSERGVTYWDWSLQPVKEPDGSVGGVVLNLVNVTDRIRAQEAVVAERQRFNDVLEMLPAYLVLLTSDYHVPFANRFFQERFGESHGRRCFEYLFGRSEPCEICETYTVLKTNAPHQWEWTGPDGRIYDVFDFPFIETDGSTLILEMGIDVTERKKAEEAVRAASLYTRSLIEAGIDPLVTISAEGKVTDVNTATEQITGHPRKELIGTDFSNYFTEPDKARKGYQQVFSEGSVRDYPLAIRHASGKVTDVLYNATVYRNEIGEIQGVFAAARDITELKRTQDALRAASLYTRSLIEASLDPLVTISADGKIMDVNKATELVTGVSREQLIGTDFSNYFTEPDKAREGYQQVFLKGSVRDYPLVIRHVSGEVRDVLYHATVYKNEVGEIHGVFAAARDITERKRIEDALRDSENRLRFLSSQLLTVQEAERKRISREVHDGIGQTLAAIKFSLENKLGQMGKGSAPPGVSLENIISLAQNGIEESRRIQMDLRPSILDDLGIISTLTWFSRVFQQTYSDIRIKKEIDIVENEVPETLKTVIYRISQEAMNNIAKHSKASLVSLSLKKRGDAIQLTIQDNGSGFDPEVTLSGENHKRGLGLSSMRERAELSGGSFSIESRIGKGTTIRAQWPI